MYTCVVMRFRHSHIGVKLHSNIGVNLSLSLSIYIGRVLFDIEFKSYWN